MPDNTFENKLNQQMGDFRFTPGEAVWQKLETDLRKRKKRRWAIIWFISGLVVLSAGLYFYSQSAIPEEIYSITENSGKSINTENNTKGGENNSTPPLKGNNNDEVYARNGQSSTEETGKTATPETLKIPELKNQSKITVNQQRKIGKQGKSQKGKIEIDQSDEYNVAEHDKTGEKTKLTADSKDTDSENFRQEPVPQKVFGKDSANQPITRHNDDPAVSSLLKGGLQNVKDSANSASNEWKVETKKRAITFGLRIDAGRSANSESAFGQSKSADLSTGPTSGGSPSYGSPYAQDPSFGWSLGIWMRKPISPRVSLVAGLAYQQYRTKTSVGTQSQGGMVLNNGVRDVMIDQYYSQGNLETYQNRYHILSLPVGITIQLNKDSKLPISWQLGLVPGWMISSNALVKAKDSSGILYSDKSMFNRFQLGLETGVGFRLFRKSRNALELGPVFQYMLTPAFKNQINYKGHLSFVGLRADWTLFTYKPRQR